MNLENQLLCATLLLITVGILAFWLWGVAVVRAVARWIGNKVATVFFGDVPGGRR
jgi:hypothetical protein